MVDIALVLGEGVRPEFRYRLRYYVEAEGTGRSLREAEARISDRLRTLGTRPLDEVEGVPAFTLVQYLGGEPRPA